MFHSFKVPSSSSSSSSPASSNYQFDAYLLDAHVSAGASANANTNTVHHLPSYFSSYPHLQEANNDSSHSKEMQGYEASAVEIAAAGKASRYSPEERKERIERYRSKRNLRNFQKKITYECRKTLADSRPRVRGRFAKNAEAESETDTAESSNGSGYAESAWWQMEAELMSADKCEAESATYNDDELWAHLVSDFSTNI